MVKAAARLPGAVGMNQTLKVQLPPAGTETPHGLDSPKSPGLAPVNAMLVMVSALLPVLFSAKVWDALCVPTVWLLNVRPVVVKLATGPIPVPVRLTVCGLPLALSVIVIAPLSDPATVGVKVTLTMQVLLGVTEAPVQVSAVLEKSAALVPPVVTVDWWCPTAAARTQEWPAKDLLSVRRLKSSPQMRHRSRRRRSPEWGSRWGSCSIGCFPLRRRCLWNRRRSLRHYHRHCHPGKSSRPDRSRRH